MKRPMTISNLRTFQQFVTQRDRAKSNEPIYGRLIGRKLKISSKPSCPGWYPDSPAIELFPLELPVPSKAREWWRDLLDGEIADFRICDDGAYTIAVISKTAMWSSIPDLHMGGNKSQFHAVTYNRFEQIVGERVFNQMLAECGCIGISVRQVWIPVKFSPARLRSRSNRRTPAREKSDHKSQI